MKRKKPAAKYNISMPIELAEYLQQAELEHNTNPANQHCPTDRSKLIQKAIRQMMLADQATQPRGQAMPDYMLNDTDPTLPQDSARIVDPTSSASGGGSSTRRPVKYPKARRAK